MKLPVTSAAADPDALWRRFVDLLFDRALAAGEELVVPQGRAVRTPACDWFFEPNDDPKTLEGLAEVLRDRRRPAVWVRPVDADAWPGDDVFKEMRVTAYTLYRLRRATTTEESSSVSVLPGRAARSAYAALCRGRFVESGRLIDADGDAPLDDPHFDPLVVLDSGQAVAMAGLQTRGQSGGLFDLYVRPDCRRRGLGTLLLGRVLELAARSQHVDLFAACESDTPAGAMLARRGFVAVAHYAVWTSGTAASSDA